MKYTIEGFNQETAVNMGLDVTDLVILRWFVDFYGTDRMAKVQFEGKEYCWISYTGLLEDMPILDMKKDTLYRRLRKLADKKVLEHTTKKINGTYSMYRLGENYSDLINQKRKKQSEPMDNKETDSDLNPRGSDLNPEGVRIKIRSGTDLNPYQKTLLLKDSSTNLSYLIRGEHFEIVDKIGLDEIPYRDLYELLVKENISYDALITDTDISKDRLDELVNIMLDILCSKRKEMVIASDTIPTLEVQERLIKIDSSHIRYIFTCMDNNTKKIYNIKKYLIAALYNAPTTIDSYYSSQVNHDMYGGIV